MLQGRTIAVIGAGIAGLAAARALALRGAEVTVLERAARIEEVGAGLQISPNGLRVLEALGLSDGLAQSSVRGQAVVLRDFRDGRPVLRLDLGLLPPDQSYFFVHRADLIELLHAGALSAGVAIRTGTGLRAVTPGPDTRLHLEDGTELRADAVIGADGLRSVLRAAMGQGRSPEFTGQVAWRALVPADPARVVPEAHVHMGPGRHIVSYPLRGGQLTNLVAVEERAAWQEEGWTHEGDPEALRRAFAGFGGEMGALLSRVERVNVWGLFRHPVADPWFAGNACLIGDAAHPMLPFLAQGANMALEDAWTLAAALDTAPSIAEGYAAFAARRHDRVSRVCREAGKNAWKYHLRPGPLRWAAHRALGLGGRLAPGLMLGGFDWLYGHDVTGPAGR